MNLPLSRALVHACPQTNYGISTSCTCSASIICSKSSSSLRAVRNTQIDAVGACSLTFVHAGVPYHMYRPCHWALRRAGQHLRVKLVELSLQVAALCVTLPCEGAQAHWLVHRCLLAPMTGATTWNACIDRWRTIRNNGNTTRHHVRRHLNLAG